MCCSLQLHSYTHALNVECLKCTYKQAYGLLQHHQIQRIFKIGVHELCFHSDKSLCVLQIQPSRLREIQ